MRETNKNFTSNKNARYDDNTPDLFTHPPNTNKITKTTKQNFANTKDINTFIMNKKEAKKFEDLIKSSHSNNYQISNNLVGITNNTGNPNPNTTKRMNKVILDPINATQGQGNMNNSKKNFYPNNKKMEVSFKATLQFTDDLGNNKKIEISPNINLHNSNITNVNIGKKRLGKIPESKGKNMDYEQDDDVNY